MSGFFILRMILLTTALPVFVTTAQPARAQDGVIQGVASVVDGDSLEIYGHRIRLFGIDAPESGQACADAGGQLYRCGQRAARALSDRIGRGTVSCWHRDTDRYGRMVAVCMLGTLDLNAWMVREGHAIAYRKYSTDYVGEENAARHEWRGIWAGSFIAPWEWRQGDRLPPERNTAQPRSATDNSTAQKPDCVIKGNISSSGARIYHVPGQRHYDRTRISPGKGEKWFCSEAQARAAGWRRARQ